MKNLRLQIIVLVIVIGLTAAMFVAYLWYRRAHPRYVPPPPRPEVTLTIIPGWNLRQVAEYLVAKGLASSTAQVYELTGEPAKLRSSFYSVFCATKHIPAWCVPDKPITLEGYLAPETIRVFADSLPKDVILKFADQRDQELFLKNPDLARGLNIAGYNTHEVLTVASLIEKEVKHDADRFKVADILWRRLARGWALQVDSSVHYAIGRSGDPFTTAVERQVDSPWNTYKYPGLPPGPIANPGLESIKAALYPEKNDFWYFLSGRDGKIYYAKTLEEHNRNKKYL